MTEDDVRRIVREEIAAALKNAKAASSSDRMDDADKDKWRRRWDAH